MNYNILDLLKNAPHPYSRRKIDSPIEEFFINHFAKYLNVKANIILQFPIETISGNFYADFAIQLGKRVITIECDGLEFHSGEDNEWYDDWRDTLILFEKKVETIYRLKGQDIYNNINSLIFIISKYDSDFLNPIYYNKLKFDDIIERNYKKIITKTYTNDSGIMNSYEIIIKRKNLTSGFDSFWEIYFLYSLSYPNKKVKELIQIFKNTMHPKDELIKRISDLR